MTTEAATQMLNAILDHFQNEGIKPEDNWAFDDEFSSMCLDHQSPDGSKFWLDIERDGTIRVLWSPGKGSAVQSAVFINQPQGKEHDDGHTQTI